MCRPLTCTVRDRALRLSKKGDRESSYIAPVSAVVELSHGFRSPPSFYSVSPSVSFQRNDLRNISSILPIWPYHLNDHFLILDLIFLHILVTKNMEIKLLKHEWIV
jgi:hypothetical protein